jgi:hypothetical protein
VCASECQLIANQPTRKYTINAHTCRLARECEHRFARHHQADALHDILRCTLCFLFHRRATTFIVIVIVVVVIVIIVFVVGSFILLGKCALREDALNDDLCAIDRSTQCVCVCMHVRVHSYFQVTIVLIRSKCIGMQCIQHWHTNTHHTIKQIMFSDHI